MEETVLRLAEEVDQKRYGKYRAFVADNADPKRIGRLRLVVPSVLDSEVTNWALPCLPFGGGLGDGFFFIPEKDAQVWVEFEEGDISRPLWTGVFWPSEDRVPKDAAKGVPTTRMLRTPAGHVLQFDDADGDTRVRLRHATESELVIEHDGSVELHTDAQASLRLDASAREVQLEDAQGNRITMNQGGVVVEDNSGSRIEMSSGTTRIEATRVVVQASQVALGDEGGEPLIKGQSFLTQYMTHRHTVAPIIGGPTSPPVPQGELSTLSTKVTTS